MTTPKEQNEPRYVHRCRLCKSVMPLNQGTKDVCDKCVYECAKEHIEKVNANTPRPEKQSAPASIWKPIQTAPLDGTRVKLLCPKGEDMGEWCDYSKNPYASIPGEWSTDFGSGEPTHWAPQESDRIAQPTEKEGDNMPHGSDNRPPQNESTEICPTCEGEGCDSYSNHRCPTCNGTGYMPPVSGSGGDELLYEPFDVLKSMHKHECEKYEEKIARLQAIIQDGRAEIIRDWEKCSADKLRLQVELEKAEKKWKGLFDLFVNDQNKIIDLTRELTRVQEALRECELHFACYENDPKYPASNSTLKTIRAALATPETKDKP